MNHIDKKFAQFMMRLTKRRCFGVNIAESATNRVPMSTDSRNCPGCQKGCNYYTKFSHVRWFTPAEVNDPPEGTHMSLSFMWKMDLFRDISGSPFIVTAGYATEGHHSATSRHYKGDAIDGYSKTLSLEEMFRLAWLMGFGGIGIYPYGGKNSKTPFIHLDDRPQPNGQVATWMRGANFVYGGIPDSFKQLII